MWAFLFPSFFVLLVFQLMSSIDGNSHLFMIIIDIKEYNEAMNDGMGNLKITICATQGYGTEEKFESIKKHLCDKYPECEGNITWRDFPVPKTVKVILVWM